MNSNFDHEAQTATVERPPLPVSVVIPAYNRADMVGRAVRSALGQRPRPPAEVIVVDDCSCDATGEAAAAAGAHVVRHDVNRGEGGARNTGIAHAGQEWVALLDSDDEWMPHLLATLWPVRSTHAMVGGASLNCAANLATCIYAGPVGRRARLLDSPRALIYPENFVAASGTMVRRRVVEAVGGYSEELKGGADMDLWIRVLEHGTGLIVPEPVVVYHLHAGQVTSDVELMVASHRAVAMRYSARTWWRASTMKRWEGAAGYDAAKRAVLSRHPRSAIRQLARILSSPNRVLGMWGIVYRRTRLRRRSMRFSAS